MRALLRRYPDFADGAARRRQRKRERDAKADAAC
jgi:hypothetical protein